MLRASDKRLRLQQRLPDILHVRPTARWYREYMLSLGPVAYWPMNDLSGLPVDVSGNGRDMTAVNGSPTYGAAGPMGEPSIDYPSAAYHERAVVSTKASDFTYLFWLRKDGTPTANGDIFTDGTTSGGITLEWNTTNGTVRGNVPGVGTLANLTIVSDLTWTMLGVGKVTGATGTINGIVNGAFVTLGTAAPGTPTGNNRILSSVSNGQRVAHLAYFDRMLTIAEVVTLYQIALGNVIPVL